MGAGGQHAGHVLPAEHGADRHAVGERLGQGHDVGLDPGVLVGPQAAGPTHAGLDLVEDQQRARGITELAQPRQVVLVGHVDAALALDRLHQDGGGAIVDRPFHRAQVVVGDVLEPRHERLEAVLVLGLAGGGDGGERPAVERVVGGDDLVPIGGQPLLGVLAGELERGLVRLGPGVREEHAVGERVLAQQLGQVDLGGRVIEVRHVQQRGRRLPDGAGHPWVAVAERGHRDAAPEVQVLAKNP